MAVRTAVIEVAQSVDPEGVSRNIVEHQLLKVKDPRKDTYRWVEDWSLNQNELKVFFEEALPGERLHYDSLEDFIQQNRLGRPKDSSSDEHYAERLFLEKAYVPIFGIAGLFLLEPQYPFNDISGRRRRIDFLLNGAKKYAIEIEGAAFHDPAKISEESFEDEKDRQRSLSSKGYAYLPFTFKDVQQGRSRDQLEEIAQEDPVLKLLLPNRSEIEEKRQQPTLIYLESLLVRFPLRYQLYQKVALTILWEATKKQKERIILADWSPTLALLPVAILDTVALVERVARLYGLEVDLPEIDVHIVGTYDKIGVYDILKSYLDAEPGQGNRKIDAGNTSVNIHFKETLPDGVDYIFADEAARPPPMKDFLWGSSLTRFPIPFLLTVGDKTPITLPKATDHEILNYFARRYFPVPELKERQYELLVKILNQESVLGILPTGYGKSLVFQLYALLIPRTTMVISPLRALIRDQINNLHRQGVLCAESITSQDNPSSKAQKYKDLQAHRYRLFYISPERLRLKDFNSEILATIKKSPIGALVVDEAHCVSEWGHDFRPGYLQIDRFHKTIEAISGYKVPVIALTATASSIVREDVLSVLDLDEDAIVQQESSDRPNLSLSVWPVNSRNRGAKSEMLRSLIAEKIPHALGRDFNEFVQLDGRTTYDHAGVIFGIYADPAGRNTIHEGIHSIADELIDWIPMGKQLIKVHASTAKRLCPYCRSHRLVYASNKELWEEGVVSRGIGPAEKYFVCLDCNKMFKINEARRSPNWDKEIRENQNEFQKSQFPFLVATKGYGMGIDKRNIRFIVHHALASGLGGYYQEAGRAGRDGKHAHVALMYIPPDPQCENEHLKGQKEKSPPKPPCVLGRFFEKWKCPYDLPVICDYGRQARFIEESYKGIETDLEHILEIYRNLEEGKRICSRRGDADDENGDKIKELALYRLQLLGLIKGYSMSYGRGFIDFEAEEYCSDWIPEEVIGCLINFLERYKAGQGKINSIKKRFQKITVDNQDDGIRGELFVSEASRILLEYIYETVPNMRYQMLVDEMNYANSKQCRRIILRSIFDDVNRLVLDKYHCNFCDVCVPDLNFYVSRAEVPTYEAELDEIVSRLPIFLESFDTKILKEVVQAIIKKEAVTSFFTRITFYLEQRYNNPSALYLAGTLCRHRGEMQEALRYLRDGFKFGIEWGLQPESLTAFYKEAVYLDAKEAFSWLLETGGPWDSSDGLEFLLDEAYQRFGKNSSEYIHLLALWKLRKHNENLESHKMIRQKVYNLMMLKENICPV
jgi:ATP-dependent DNA helicase RecQ